MFAPFNQKQIANRYTANHTKQLEQDTSNNKKYEKSGQASNRTWAESRRNELGQSSWWPTRKRLNGRTKGMVVDRYLLNRIEPKKR